MSWEPPFGFHAVQISLHLPRVLSVHPFTKLPQPNAIDDWLDTNYTDNIPGYMHLGDLLSSELMCILQLQTQTVRVLLNSQPKHLISQFTDPWRR